MTILSLPAKRTRCHIEVACEGPTILQVGSNLSQWMVATYQILPAVSDVTIIFVAIDTTNIPMAQCTPVFSLGCDKNHSAIDP